MRKLTLKLKSFNSGNGHFFAKKYIDPVLCRAELSELFTLPRNNSTPISVVLSGKKLPESYKARLIGSSLEVFHNGSWNHKATYYDARQLLRDLKLGNKTFWVTLYWEE